MANIPGKVETRIKEGIRRYRAVLESAKARDVGEADTSTIVKDILSEICGYDKYSEITAEFQIKGTYCDLAIKLDGKLALLVEVKAIGSELKEAHTKQAVDYAANQGVEWVILTNGVVWQIYRVTFGQPIGQEMLLSIDLLTFDPKNEGHVAGLYLLCREAHTKSLLAEYHQQRQALSRFFMGAVVLSEPVLSAIRRELRRASPDVKVEIDDIRAVLRDEVIKREILEGERADEAKKKMARLLAKAERARATSSPTDAGTPEAAAAADAGPGGPAAE